MDALRSSLVFSLAAAVWFPTLAAAQQWNNSTAPNYSGQYTPPAPPSNPSLTQRAQSAFAETGTALQNGLESVSNASGQLSNPFTNSNAPNSSTNTAKSGVSSPWNNTQLPAPPSYPSNSNAAATSSPGTPVATSSGGWTSIGTSIAAPPLLVPQTPMNTANYSSPATTIVRSAPSNTPSATNESQPFHSVLVDPSKTAPPTASNNSSANWADNWSGNNTGGATIGNNAAGATPRDVNFGSTQPLAGNTPDPRNGPGTGISGTSSPWNNNESWPQGSPPSLASANNNAGTNHQVSPPPLNNMAGNNSPGGGLYTNQPNNQTQFPQPSPPGGTNPLANNNQGLGQNTTLTSGGQLNNLNNTRNTKEANTATQEQPWMPLIASVLTLAGSLAANLYLGVSYLDARQKYQSLVRKTADTFRRVKAVAA
jgi:hypothetical protein